MRRKCIQKMHDNKRTPESAYTPDRMLHTCIWAMAVGGHRPHWNCCYIARLFVERIAFLRVTNDCNVVDFFFFWSQRASVLVCVCGWCIRCLSAHGYFANYTRQAKKKTTFIAFRIKYSEWKKVNRNSLSSWLMYKICHICSKRHFKHLLHE